MRLAPIVFKVGRLIGFPLLPTLSSKFDTRSETTGCKGLIDTKQDYHLQMAKKAHIVVHLPVVLDGQARRLGVVLRQHPQLDALVLL